MTCEREQVGSYSFMIWCGQCGGKYFQWLEDRIPLDGRTDYDYCPYCGTVNLESREYIFHNIDIRA